MNTQFLADLGRLPGRVRAYVWDEHIERRGALVATSVKAVRLFWAVIRDLRSGEPSLQAMSLVYTTILSIVPLLAVSFSVLKGFGVHEKLANQMMRFLVPFGEEGIDIGMRIIDFVENVQVGVLGSLGLAFLLYTVISLMHKVESAFNHTWHVSQNRPFAQRFSGYLTVVIIGPVLVFSSMGITATLMSTEMVASITAIEPFGTVIGWAGALLPFALVVGAFTFIYVFMPNTRVRLVSAFAGALVAGALWHLASWAFASFVVKSTQTAAIYAAFAGLIFFMLWLYVAWLILLIGASVAYYHQNPDQTTAEKGHPTLSARMAERIALALLAEVANRFRDGEAPLSTSDLAERLAVPPGIADKVLQVLRTGGFLITVDPGLSQWMPTRPLDRIALDEVLACMRAAGEETGLAAGRVVLTDPVARTAATAETRGSMALRGCTAGDLLDRRPAQGDTPPETNVARLRDIDAASGDGPA